MTNIHPEENEIQNFVLYSNQNPEIADHIQHCKSCNAKAGQYTKLFTEIHLQEAPSFEFDIVKLVIKQLPQTKTKFSFYKHLNYTIVLIVVTICLALLYFSSHLFLNIFLNVAPILILLITTVAVCISIALFIDMYKKHQKKMDLINYY